MRLVILQSRSHSLLEAVRGKGDEGQLLPIVPGGDAPAAECTSLDTSPHAPRTHWGQTALLFKPQPSARPVALRVGLEKSRESHHDLNFTVAYREGGEDVVASYSITNDFRGYTADERAKDEL